MKVPIISITPVSAEIIKARLCFAPIPIRETVTIIPSGIFCKAIAVAIRIPFDMSSVPKPTPAATPSGRLCKAIAEMKRITLLARLSTPEEFSLDFVIRNSKKSRI